ncbi:hypothetical protein ACFQVC_16110 [Streptomyces monticola]|uniref:DUF3995 domain-containing protein n=1 Tax=Streptomyces monticola TaxID=2666263 RepID=A0ABW2JI33_9ACTN
MGRDEFIGCGGCAAGFVGAIGAVTLWGTSERTRVHLGGGFENNGMDLSVLWTELPLVAVAGCAVPTLVWVLIGRFLGRRGAAESELDQ